ncbi:hypothetical protein V493_03580 [Pseudogymnoascus sp. VKM F-4281 (FW-2241)]|nr:hypothetical protein V493_03580 [Pseudogymnoascus sp. VKM F-4281 (FW-2241)]
MTASAAAPSGSRSPEVDERHKRVWKACERCRMKKTKCDGESPCKRCRDDSVVCTVGHLKKAEFKQLPAATPKSSKTPNTPSSPQSTSPTPWSLLAYNGPSNQ